MSTSSMHETLRCQPFFQTVPYFPQHQHDCVPYFWRNFNTVPYKINCVYCTNTERRDIMAEGCRAKFQQTVKANF